MPNPSAEETRAVDPLPDDLRQMVAESTGDPNVQRWDARGLVSMSIWGGLGAVGFGVAAGALTATSGTYLLWLAAVLFAGACTGCSVAAGARRAGCNHRRMMALWGLLAGLVGTYVSWATVAYIGTEGRVLLPDADGLLWIASHSADCVVVGLVIVPISALVAGARVSFRSLVEFASRTLSHTGLGHRTVIHEGSRRRERRRER
jgi:hypothetical protein